MQTTCRKLRSCETADLVDIKFTKYKKKYTILPDLDTTFS